MWSSTRVPGRAQLAELTPRRLTQAEYWEHPAQCNCFRVLLLFISGLPVLMQLCIKHLMPNSELWLIVFFFRLGSAHCFIHCCSHLFTSLTAFLLLAIGIVPKLLFFVRKKTAIVTEAKLKTSCPEQGHTESGKRPNKEREICYFSFPIGLRKMYKT